MTIRAWDPRERYLRQEVLPGFGPAGTRRLAAATVSVTGPASLAAWTARYLAGAGVGGLSLSLSLDPPGGPPENAVQNRALADELRGLRRDLRLEPSGTPVDLRVVLDQNGALLAGGWGEVRVSLPPVAGAGPARDLLAGALAAGRAISLLAGLEPPPGATGNPEPPDTDDAKLP